MKKLLILLTTILVSCSDPSMVVKIVSNNRTLTVFNDGNLYRVKDTVEIESGYFSSTQVSYRLGLPKKDTIITFDNYKINCQRAIVIRVQIP